MPQGNGSRTPPRYQNPSRSSVLHTMTQKLHRTYVGTQATSGHTYVHSTSFEWLQRTQHVANASFALWNFPGFFFPKIFSIHGWISKWETCGGKADDAMNITQSSFIFMKNIHGKCFPSVIMNLFYVFLFLGRSWFTVPVNLFKWEMWEK